MEKVILNSLPKSGTHVLVRALELLKFKDSKKHLSGSLVKRYASDRLIKRCVRGGLLYSDKFFSNKYCVDLDSLDRRISTVRLGLILRGIHCNEYAEAHLPHTLELESLLKNRGFKLIYITRDPRDVAVSYINHINRDDKYPLYEYFNNHEFKDKLDKVINGHRYSNGDYMLAPLKERIEHSIGWIDRPNVLSLKFEDIIGPEGGGSIEKQRHSLMKIVDFLNLNIDSIEFDSVLKNIFYKKSETFHKGVIGAHKDLNEDYSSLLERELKKEIKLLNYDLTI